MDFERIGKRSTAAKGKVSGLAIVLIILIFGIVGYYNNVFCSAGYCPTNLSLQTANTTNAQGGYLGQATASFVNAITGASISSATVKMYPPSAANPSAPAQISTDTFTGSASPYTSSTYIYNNGGTYWISATASSIDTVLQQFNPGVTTAALKISAGQSVGSLGIVYSVTPPTYAIICTWDNNTSFNSAQSYNFTSGTQDAQQTINCSLKNTATQTGWISTYDPLNKQTQNVICQWNDTNSAQTLAITGYGQNSPGQNGFGSSGSIREGAGLGYYYIVPDGIQQGTGTSPDGQPVSVVTSQVGAVQVAASGITNFKPISTISQVGGTYTFSIQIGKGNLAHGSSEIATLGCYQAADVSVYSGPTKTLNNFGPDAVSKISVAVTFKV